MTQTTQVRRIAARPDLVFQALVSPEMMVEWWGCYDAAASSVVSDLRVGGRYEVRFPAGDGREHVCGGEYLEIVRPERLVMSWRWLANGVDEERDRVSRVEIRLRAIELGTELTLIHSALRSDGSAHAHAAGWAGSLDKLVQRFAQAPGRSITGSPS